MREKASENAEAPRLSISPNADTPGFVCKSSREVNIQLRLAEKLEHVA